MMSEKNDSTGSKELQRILFKSQRKDVKTIWDKLPKEVQIYVFKKIREKNCVDLGKLYIWLYFPAYRTNGSAHNPSYAEFSQF